MILVHVTTANCHTYAGNVYIAAFSSRILQVSTTGIIISIAGTGNYSYSGDGGAASSASFRQPFGVGVDTSGIIIEYCLSLRLSNSSLQAMYTCLIGRANVFAR